MSGLEKPCHEVSVIIPTMGRSRYLDDAIQSVLAQDLQPIELLVIDDNGCGSSQQLSTERLIAQYGDQVRYIVNDKNSGVAASRNRGGREASGRFIAFLDDDDIFLPEKLSTQIAAMQEKEADISFCGYFNTDETLNVKGTEHQAPIISVKEFLTEKTHTQASTLIVRRDSFLRTKGFPEDLQFREDTLFVMRVLASGGVPLGIDRPLFKHRAHRQARLSQGANDISRFDYTYSRWCEEQEPLLALVPHSVARQVRFERAYKYLKNKRRMGISCSLGDVTNVMLLAFKAKRYTKAFAALKVFA